MQVIKLKPENTRHVRVVGPDFIEVLFSTKMTDSPFVVVEKVVLWIRILIWLWVSYPPWQVGILVREEPWRHHWRLIRVINLET
jgi:hypothetical protein